MSGGGDCGGAGMYCGGGGSGTARLFMLFVLDLFRILLVSIRLYLRMASFSSLEVIYSGFVKAIFVLLKIFLFFV